GRPSLERQLACALHLPARQRFVRDLQRRQPVQQSGSRKSRAHPRAAALHQAHLLVYPLASHEPRTSSLSLKAVILSEGGLPSVFSRMGNPSRRILVLFFTKQKAPHVSAALLPLI